VLQEQRQLYLPSYEGAYADVKDAAAIQAVWSSFSALWRPVHRPEPFAIALFEFGNGQLHCGVMADARRLLHVERGKDACIEPVARFSNQFRQFYTPA
jgi:hypothetical protein